MYSLCSEDCDLFSQYSPVNNKNIFLNYRNVSYKGVSLTLTVALAAYVALKTLLPYSGTRDICRVRPTLSEHYFRRHQT